MSYSTLYAVFRKSARALKEYRNGHGSAPPVWGWLRVNKLSLSEHGWLGENDESKRLWALAYDPTVPREWRATLGLTLDLAYIPTDKLTEAAELFERVGTMLAGWRPQNVNHWPAIAADFRAFAAKPVPRMVGLGLCCTSVSDPWSDWSYSGGKEGKTFDAWEYTIAAPERAAAS